MSDESQIDGEQGESQRAAARDSLMLKSELKFPATGEGGEVRVRNLSAGGMMAEAPIQARRGEPVELQLRNIGWITGKVAWVAEGRFGIAFDVPIDPKLARKPTSSGTDANPGMPNYLKRLNQPPPKPKDLRRLG